MVTGNLERIPVDSGNKVKDNLDGVSKHQRAQSYTHSHYGQFRGVKQPITHVFWQEEETRVLRGNTHHHPKTHEEQEHQHVAKTAIKACGRTKIFPMVTLQLSAPKCFLKLQLTLTFISLEWHVLFLSIALSFVNLLF